MRIGTIGSGSIVEWILTAVAQTEGISCGAVYSRKEETGRKLADKFGVQKVYTDLDAMCQDVELDFIYIASPNSLHYEQAKKALSYGKNVICEKPFTPKLSEAQELAELAKEKHLFLFEGITVMYLPNYELIREKMGEIGNLKIVTAEYCQYSSRYDALMAGELPNVFNPAFAGGALMDINLYNLYFMCGLFGKPEQVQYFATRHANGIDTNGLLVMQYPDFRCQCTGAKDTWCENTVQIMGDKGYIRVPGGSNGCKEFTVVTKEKQETYNLQNGTPWFYEIQGITKIVSEENYEECYRRLEKTLEVVEILEKAR
jgi:predicted dehydrogenase